MGALSGGISGQVVRQRFQEDVPILDRHRRADVDLHGQHALQLPPLLVEVDHVDRRMAVDPVPMVVPLDEDPVVVPLAGRERP